MERLTITLVVEGEDLNSLYEYIRTTQELQATQGLNARLRGATFPFLFDGETAVAVEVAQYVTIERRIHGL